MRGAKVGILLRKWELIQDYFTIIDLNDLYLLECKKKDGVFSEKTPDMEKRAQEVAQKNGWDLNTAELYWIIKVDGRVV